MSKMPENTNVATELEFLRFYRKEAKEVLIDYNIRCEDYQICKMFEEETGKNLPEEYEEEVYE